MENAGVVEEDVDRLRDAGEGLDRRGVRLVVDVALGAADLAGDPGKSLAVPIGEHDPSPMGVERPRHAASEPARGPGDEHPPPGEVEVLRFYSGHRRPPLTPSRGARRSPGSRAPLLPSAPGE